MKYVKINYMYLLVTKNKFYTIIIMNWKIYLLITTIQKYQLKTVLRIIMYVDSFIHFLFYVMEGNVFHTQH